MPMQQPNREREVGTGVGCFRKRRGWGKGVDAKRNIRNVGTGSDTIDRGRVEKKEGEMAETGLLGFV